MELKKTLTLAMVIALTTSGCHRKKDKDQHPAPVATHGSSPFLLWYMTGSRPVTRGGFGGSYRGGFGFGG